MEEKNRIKSIIEQVSKGVIQAGTTFSSKKVQLYEEYMSNEKNDLSKWVIRNILDNEKVARNTQFNLCDDTGIPHLILEMGEKAVLTTEYLEAIQEGLATGLRRLPGRPMAVKGNEVERVEQSKGLFEDPAMMVSAPIMIVKSKIKQLRLHILLQGGGPEIRSKTYRVFHKHSYNNVIDEIIKWAKEEVSNLGCTPCIPCIGIGRSHYEATAMMLLSMIEGKFDIQSDTETRITEEINRLNVGPLGLGGNTTAIATFLKTGPQRASGVRIVSLRLSCNVEPRLSSIDIKV
ncbi:fumarate hydratase [Candidatus Izimaplasma bacterium HR1]|jgi:fumarate hydratase subunit alpha|uniref:fumarate hydratase n=1 Tax=Candidatus Izimoplasma sp. HR1 TaxID=1541959 RepID=UPI0004F6F5D0|nr:fumarate hydratase [Candidatus Izimaplasma bacterium HR1]